MLVSCVLVSHNKPQICHEAVQSVVNQTHEDWELILVDSGVLYDQGYFENFSWSCDERITIIRSIETEEIRKTKAMAPWCYNETYRNGLLTNNIKNDGIVVFLCDDDFFYCCAFQVFSSYFESHLDALAVYGSQDIGVIYPNGWRAVVGERRALVPAGLCVGVRIDCVFDYLQFAIKSSLLSKFSWPEGKETESHADGVLYEQIGSIMPIHPIDVKISQNRRVPQSTYCPSR